MQRTVYYYGQLPVQQVADLIQRQMIRRVEVRGQIWTVKDDDSFFVVTDDAGTRAVSRDEYLRSLAVDEALAHAGNLRIELALSSADAAISRTQLDLGASCVVASLTGLAGGAFDLHDGETTYITNYTVLQNTPAVQSSQSSRTSGLTISLRPRWAGEFYLLRGTVELSSLDSETRTRVRSIPVNVIDPPGQWINVATVAQADLDVSLRKLAASLSGSVYSLWVRVLPAS